ncbi:NAD(P)H-quinone oxidoreductase [Labrys wisconsinensis]|uniref:NADPH2:quinone reductase n=1 Tax=Labrys wisconsinensis TaxID=425677 RepID=A0ABU0JA49_9HYPH|nr:NAD(P)H-quinone oxidoreductase [Labrys wisconsinensis]MDQ0471141.1 NADPH2:quinone reductase [Labrys wisconsinensis]
MTTLPDEMRVMAIREPGGPQVLTEESRPLPTPGETDILIRVAAAGVNRPDLLQRAGVYPPPPGASDLPGLEVAGEVAAVGYDVRRWKVGDKVCALVAGGGYAEYVLAPESNALPVPAGMDMVQAAALPETGFTVWHNVFERGRLTEGETFLVHGGSSGIGTTAIMLAKAFGATVFTTAGSPEKCEACRKLGADLAIDYKTADWVAEVREASGGRGVDLILDMVGGDYVAKNYSAAAMDGRIVQIAFLRGSKVELDLVKLMTKRLTHTGSTMRPQSVASKARIARELEDKVWPLLAAGACRPVIHATLPLADAAKAHALLEAGDHVGKVVLTVP